MDEQKQFSLSAEEKLKLENSALRLENMKLLVEKEQNNQIAIIEQVCKRLSKDKEDISGLDINLGIITFKEKGK